MALLFLGIPFIFAYAERIPLLRAFRVRGSGLLFWLVAILLGLSSGILVMELTVLGMQAGWLELRPELKQLLDKRAAEFQAVPLPLILATLALLPAGVEECFFRGYLFKALETRFSMLATIGVSSLCFAAFHICSSSGLVWERLLPSLLMGVVLGCIAWRSGSVLPGMVLHALNNAVLLTLSRYKDSFVAWQWLAEKSEHVPMSWLIVATIATLLGGVLLAFGRTSSLERAASELG